MGEIQLPVWLSADITVLNNIHVYTTTKWHDRTKTLYIQKGCVQRSVQIEE